MAQYCEICGQITNCNEDCKKCLEEEEQESGQKTTERTH